MRKPTEADAKHIVEEATGKRVVSVTRFLTGYCHYVYEARLADGISVVARIASDETRHDLLGGLYWRAKLEPLGVPLPKMLHAETRGAFACMILERLPGRDLGLAYPELNDAQKRELAMSIANAQSRCAQLPQAHGYGYARSYDDPALRENQSWRDVLVGDLERSSKRLIAVGAVDAAVTDRVFAHFSRFDAYLSRVQPVAFMDDTTTRNVLVHEGKLSGIVDVDSLCFGDGLFTVALTRLALLTLKQDTQYIDYWLEAMNATSDQRAVLNLYTAIFCVNFLSEQGQVFNREKGTINHDMIAFLNATLDELLADL